MSEWEMGNKGCFRGVKCVAEPQLDLRMPVSATRNSLSVMIREGKHSKCVKFPF